jgi:hypothetical protein
MVSLVKGKSPMVSLVKESLLFINVTCSRHDLTENVFICQHSCNQVFVSNNDAYMLRLWCLMPFSTIFQLYRGG